MLERVLGQLNDDELRDTIRVLERLEQAINAAGRRWLRCL
jgi:hypothetical protein